MSIYQLVKTIEKKQLQPFQKKCHELRVGDTIRLAVLTREFEPIKDKKDKKDKKKTGALDNEEDKKLLKASVSEKGGSLRAKVKDLRLDKWKIKDRVQPYEGTIIAETKKANKTTVTVRRVFQGIGVERIFPLPSPSILWINLQRRTKVRRAKLYYLRYRSGRATRLREATLSPKRR